MQEKWRTRVLERANDLILTVLLGDRTVGSLIFHKGEEEWIEKWKKHVEELNNVFNP